MQFPTCRLDFMIFFEILVLSTVSANSKIILQYILMGNRKNEKTCNQCK